MSSKYSVTEPHPSVSKANNSYIYGGRGGAGNYKRYQSSTLSSGPSASGPAARTSLARPAQRTVASGRGGAGNMYKQSAIAEEPMFQFDEELRRREKQTPVYHIGRGGAANFVDESQPRMSRSGSSDSASTASDSSSVRDVFGRLTRKLSKN